MIFLAVGSWHKGFDRLVRAIDEFKRDGIIFDEVKAQIGSGLYKPTNIEFVDYYSPEEFVKMITESKFVIAHAGMGTIIETTKQRKNIIVMPRKSELGEANTNHQFDTAEVLEEEGKVLVAKEAEDIPLKLKEAETFIATPGKGSTEIIDAIQMFIDDVIANRCSQ